MPEETKKEAPKAAAASGSDDTKLFGALCYIIGLIVPLFVLFTEKKENKFLAFHAWQSLIFSLIAMAVIFVIGGILMVVSFVAAAVTAMIGGIGGAIYCLIFPIVGVVIVYDFFVAYKAYQGEKYMIPVIGEFALKQVK